MCEVRDLLESFCREIAELRKGRKNGWLLGAFFKNRLAFARPYSPAARRPSLRARHDARRHLLHHRLEPVQRPVDETELLELADGVLEILPARAAGADALQDEPRRLFQRQPPGI